LKDQEKQLVTRILKSYACGSDMDTRRQTRCLISAESNTRKIQLLSEKKKIPGIERLKRFRKRNPITSYSGQELSMAPCTGLKEHDVAEYTSSLRKTMQKLRYLLACDAVK
jgi:hypothetical protein